ncbi:MAG: hypothetical protein ABIK28_18780, partial [Planctomycetota bacterium]
MQYRLQFHSGPRPRLMRISGFVVALCMITALPSLGKNLVPVRSLSKDLLASTFMGGSGNEGEFRQMSVVIDGNGCVFVAGQTRSPDFPVTPGAWDSEFNGDFDLFIAKLDHDLKTCLAATYLGGSDFEGGIRGAPFLCVGNDNSLYVAGQTRSQDFPTTPGAYAESLTSGYDLFVTHLDNDLTTLLASTYLGGSKLDNCSAICMASNGDLFVSGYTKSTDYPTTPGAYDTQYNGQTGTFGGDLVVSRLSPDLGQLIASTYVGGSAWELDAAMSLDSEDNLYICGSTASADFPTTPGAYEPQYHPGSAGLGADCIVFKMNENLDTLLCSTFLGGTFDDWGYTLMLDGSGHVYVAGHTSSVDFPVSSGAYDTIFNGLPGIDVGDDLFITRLDPALSSIEGSTYIGGAHWDMPNALVSLPCGDIIVSGQAASDDFPTTSGALGETYSGGSYAWGGEAVIVRFDADLQTLRASTFLGGSGQEGIGSMVIDHEGTLYVSGYTNSEDFPVTPGAYDVSYNGSGAGVETGDAYITRLETDLAGKLTLMADPSFLSVSQGGVVDLLLSAGPEHANRTYLILASVSGTTPGFPLPSAQA